MTARKYPTYMVDEVRHVLDLVLTIEPLELDFRTMPAEDVNAISKVVDTSTDAFGNNLIRVKSLKAEESMGFKKLGTVDAVKLSKKMLGNYVVQLSIPRPLVTSLNSLALKGEISYRLADTTSFLVHDYSREQLQLGHLILQDYLHQKFTRVLEVTQEQLNTRLEKFQEVQQIYSTAGYMVYAVLARIGIVNGLQEAFHSSKSYYAGTIIDVVSSYLTQQTTRLGSSTNKYGKEVLSLTGKVIDHRSISEIANNLVTFASRGFITLTRVVNGKEVNLVTKAQSQFELISYFFEHAMTYRFRNYVIDCDQYSQALGIVESGKAIDDSWQYDQDEYNAIPVADELNLEQMKLAYLGVTKPKGRTPKGFYQAKPQYRLPKGKPGRPTKEHEKAKAIQREAEEWAKNEAKAHAKKQVSHNKNLVKKAKETVANVEARELHNIVDCFNSKSSIASPDKLFSPLPVLDTVDQFGNPVEQIPKRVLIDITTFKSDAEGISLTELGHMGTDRKNWNNVLKVLFAVDMVTGSVVAYRTLHGNISDQSVMEQVLDYLRDLGYLEICIIADRGFSKELTHKFLSAHGIRFVFMANNKTDLQKRLRKQVLDDFAGEGKKFSRENFHAGQIIKAVTLTYEEAGYTNAQGELIDADGDLILDDDGSSYVVEPGYDKLTSVVFFSPSDNVDNYVHKRSVTLELVDMVNQCPEILNSLADDQKPYAKYLKFNDVTKQFEINEEMFEKKVLTEKTNACITNIDAADAKLVLDIYRMRWSIETIFRQIKHSFGENEALYVQTDATGAVKLGCIFIAVVTNLFVKINEVRLHNTLGASLCLDLTPNTYSDCDYFKPENFRNIRISDGKMVALSGVENSQGKALRALTGLGKPTLDFCEQVHAKHQYKK